ncbi:MAG: hypothetical protein RMH84_03615 [Sulfolobales archaeon]|nr:hypothetical protein [Sulfolobales archaeon]MCX8208379.1 hypothetical protein [Sulfolobales archaeon]MDW8010662.1 hypothetical protein [Sulfolobales archaeon]
MLKATREAVYRYRKRGVEEICEIVATPIGRFVVVHRALKGRYSAGDREEEWDLLNHKSFQDVKNVVLEYEDLPADVRRALSRAG